MNFCSVAPIVLTFDRVGLFADVGLVSSIASWLVPPSVLPVPTRGLPMPTRGLPVPTSVLPVPTELHPPPRLSSVDEPRGATPEGPVAGTRCTICPFAKRCAVECIEGNAAGCPGAAAGIVQKP